MTWTSEPPTLPGYYWWKEHVFSEPRFVLLGYHPIDTQLSVIWPSFDTTGIWYAKRMGGYWAIPRKGNVNEMDK